MTIRIAIAFFFVLVVYSPLQAQPGEKISLNSGWQFALNDEPNIAVASQTASWQRINLPHTWNALDIIDDTVGYHRGIGWYARKLFIPDRYRGQVVRLWFEGVCNKATVYINGEKATEHSGGFTGFSVVLDSLVEFGESNNIWVRVDNRSYLSDSIPPYSGDFNLMGGIYRDAWLVVTKTYYFHPFGNEGITFETPAVSETEATFRVRALRGGVAHKFAGGSLSYELRYRGQVVQSGSEILTSKRDYLPQFRGVVKNPGLWSPETPELYQLRIQLKNKQGELIGESEINVGFRWFGISEKNEFMLNGKPYKLKGASRHQDYERLGNALTDAMHIRDIELMKQMGCNFIRIAHYPQDPAIYDACDRLGLIAWSEIPVVDKVVDNPTFFENSLGMMAEMVWQHYNHPCIAIWGYHNEVRNLDNSSIASAKALDSTARGMDPYRLTAMAFESNIDAPYFKNPLLKEMLNIAMINGYNVYQGWYRGNYEQIGSFLDTLYAYNPSRPIMLSEYGTGSLVNIYTDKPTIFDFSEEYQCRFHESYVRAGSQRPWMIGFAIWNFIDFQRDGREDVKPNINKKGMVTTDRRPKDVYYYYKSQWSKEPFIHITGRNWKHRYAIMDHFPGTREIKSDMVVYSNQKQVQLYCNGKAAAIKLALNGKLIFTVFFKEGDNTLLCKTPDNKLADMIHVQYDFIETATFSQNKSWRQLHFNTGQSRTSFTDPKSEEQWIPDKPYSAGSWGYVGGEVWSNWPSAAWNGIREGIHKPIANTDNEPVFQTFVQGLSAWKADVSAGKYRVSLLLCEPFTARQRSDEERVFSIDLNGELWSEALNLEQQFGPQTAVILDKEIIVKDKEGIEINFHAIKGKTILNGVRIFKL